MKKTEIDITGIIHLDQFPGHPSSYLRQACSTAIFRVKGNEKRVHENICMSLSIPLFEECGLLC
jgi:hypothetical protein